MPLFIVRNDITKMRVDAIVNAANNSLLGGGGVDGAIHRAAGPELLAECRTLGGCETGEAKATGGYDLPAKYVIHTVGPVWHGGKHGEKELLTSCYCNSLAVAEELGCRSVAFPLISAGVYGYPRREAFRVASDTVKRHLENSDITVYIVLFDRDSVNAVAGDNSDIDEYIDERYVYAHSDAQSVYDARRREALLYAKHKEKYSINSAKPAPCGSAPTTDHAPYVQFSQAAPPLQAELADYCEDEEPCAAIKPEQSTADSAKNEIGDPFSVLDESFAEMLLRKIDEKGMTDPECYKRANVDRKLFSKIRSNPNYRPSRTTAIAFAVALELDLAQTRELLMKAGYALSRSTRFDVIIEYAIMNGNYDIHSINEILFSYDQPLLGNVG